MKFFIFSLEYGRTETAILFRIPYGLLDEKNFMGFIN